MSKPELWGIAEIAEAFGVSLRTVHGWLERYPDFPEPEAELKLGRVWKAAAVRRWHRKTESLRRPGRRQGAA